MADQHETGRNGAGPEPSEPPPADVTPDDAGQESTAALLGGIAREIEEFVGAGGWQQPPQLFALVPTTTLLARQPELADQLADAAALTPIAQEALPSDDLAEALAQIEWPDTVDGCALAQEIVILPPEAQQELAQAGGRAAELAGQHPRRREARLVAVVHRDATATCVLRLRPPEPGQPSEPGEPEEIVEHPELAPNLVQALLATFG